MINENPHLPPNILKYLQLKPQARPEFEQKLHQRLLAAEIPSLSLAPTPRKTWLVFPSFKKWAFITIAGSMAIIITLISFQPAWSKMRERIRRFFMITTTENSIPTSTYFWSNLQQNEIVPGLPYNVSTNNSLIPEEERSQKIPPPGFTSIADYIITMYHLDAFTSLSDIVSHTPAKVIREGSYYTTGKVYVLEFPEGLIIYTEVRVSTSPTSSTLIRTIR